MTQQDTPSASRRYVVVIPAYREQEAIGQVVSGALRYGDPVIVVDDGSDDATAERAAAAGARVIRHEGNRGKGLALQSGFDAAREAGCDALITLDGDGQHDPAEIPRFKEAYERTGIPVLIGNRMTDVRRMPWLRKLTNWGLSRLLSRKMGQYVPDTQCGYRLYRCDIIPHVAAESERFAAESEILVNIAKRGITIGSLPISTIYGRQKSSIHPIRDTVRFLRMYRRMAKAARYAR